MGAVVGVRILVATILFAAHTAWAVDPATHITQYSHTAWRMQDGFFTGAPTAIAQTTDGYLWMGTANGLFRFDGVRFAPWADIAPQKQLESVEVSALLRPDGRTALTELNSSSVERGATSTEIPLSVIYP
jgi:ligand-binding sensor domain-containing protein